MAWTQEQLDSLDAALAEGVLTVKYQDKTVTYRSVDEMLKLRHLMRRALCLDAGDSGRRYAQFNKGMR